MSGWQNVGAGPAQIHTGRVTGAEIIVGAQLSTDAVMQAPGEPWEDPTKGFKFGGWAMPYFDEVFGLGAVVLP